MTFRGPVAQKERMSPLESAHTWWSEQCQARLVTGHLFQELHPGGASLQGPVPGWGIRQWHHHGPTPTSFQTTTSKPMLGLSLQHLLVKHPCQAGHLKDSRDITPGGQRAACPVSSASALGRSCVSVDRSSEPSTRDWLPEGQLPFTRSSVPSSRGAKQCSG